MHACFSTLLVSRLVVLHLADRVAMEDLLHGVFAWESHRWGQMSQRGQSGSGHQPRVLLHEHATAESAPRLVLRTRYSLHEDQCGHGLDNGHGSGDDARVVSALCGENTFGPVVSRRWLFLGDGSRWLESDPAKGQSAVKERWDLPEVNVLSVGDTALDTTAPVGRCPQLLLPSDGMCALDESVVVLGSREGGASEARSDLKALCRRDGQHGMG